MSSHIASESRMPPRQLCCTPWRREAKTCRSGSVFVEGMHLRSLSSSRGGRVLITSMPPGIIGVASKDSGGTLKIGSA